MRKVRKEKQALNSFFLNFNFWTKVRRCFSAETIPREDMFCVEAGFNLFFWVTSSPQGDKSQRKKNLLPIFFCFSKKI